MACFTRAVRSPEQLCSQYPARSPPPLSLRNSRPPLFNQITRIRGHQRSGDPTRRLPPDRPELAVQLCRHCAGNGEILGLSYRGGLFAKAFASERWVESNGVGGVYIA